MVGAMLALTALLTVLNIIVAGRNIWEKWHAATPAAPHPLDAALRDVAVAIRERRHGLVAQEEP